MYSAEHASGDPTLAWLQSSTSAALALPTALLSGEAVGAGFLPGPRLWGNHKVISPRRMIAFADHLELSGF
jgi:hypothetical protein